MREAEYIANLPKERFIKLGKVDMEEVKKGPLYTIDEYINGLDEDLRAYYGPAYDKCS